jgi:RHS repeat-associated protein
MTIAAEINGSLYAIHTDHLNTPRRLTNQQGQVAWQWLFSGLGEVRPTTGDRGYGQTVSGPSYAQAVKFDLRYPGQVFDEETGLSYNLHRYYDAATGRYMQADPIGLEGGWNRFGYVNGNPLSYVDPLGLAGFVPGGGGAVDTGDMCQPLLLKNPMDDNGCLRPFVAGGPSLCVGPGSLGKAGPALGSMTKEELKALIGKDQTELLRQLFGTGIPGANNALSNLTRPEALTNQAVNAYRELATRAISQYERSGNAAAADLQRLRLEILNRLK